MKVGELERQRVVVLGAGGMLGRAFFEIVPRVSSRFDLCFFAREDCDVRDIEALKGAINTRTATVINCAAWTDVDGAERNREAALELNHLAPQELARHCVSTGSTLVHFSSDYVFDGASTVPYTVDQATGPINVYGQSKLLGEQAIRATACDHLMIRTSWLFAPWGKNFVRTMLRLGAERDELRVVDDQVGRPTSCLDLAQATLALLDHGARGTFHVANQGQASWHQFASVIMDRAHLGCRVTPCSSSEYHTAAKRPKQSVLDLSALERLDPPLRMRAWQPALDDVLQRIADEDDTSRP